MECFVTIVNGFQPLTIITKHSILDVATALDPPLETFSKGVLRTSRNMCLYLKWFATVVNDNSHRLLLQSAPSYIQREPWTFLFFMSIVCCNLDISQWNFNLIQDGPFCGCSRMEGGAKRPPLLNLSQISCSDETWSSYKLRSKGLKTWRIWKIYKSCGTPIEFCWHQHFFHRKSTTFVISRKTDIGCFLIHNFYFF